MTVEACGMTKCQTDWSCCPRLDKAEQCRRGSIFYLVLAAECDVRGDERSLKWIKGLPQCIQSGAPRRRYKERELSSAVQRGGHGGGGICVA